jgi:hypothetical protein
MTSERYQLLRDRIGCLREHLLPADFSDIGEYVEAERVAIMAISFRVLAHAEIETYFEDRVVEIAKAALKAWKQTRYICPPLFCMVAFSGRDMRKPPGSLLAPSDNKVKVWPVLLDPSERVRECVAQFVRAVQHDNHGIREQNLLSMLLPIGFNSSDLDPVVVTDLDSLGRRRGEAAHSSSTLAQVQQGVNPEEEDIHIRRLLVGIDPIDGILDELLKTAGSPSEDVEAPVA